MNNPTPPRKRVFPVLITALAGLFLSCTFGLPTSSSAGSGSGGLLPDPTVGLAALTGYHASLQMDVTGTLNGDAFERHTRLELTRAPKEENYDFSLTLQGSAEPTAFLRVIALSQASYVWDSPDGYCRGEIDDQTAKKLIDPSSMLYPVSKTTKVGSDSVNGIPATHYRFDQNSIPLADPKPKASGELWIADSGGYIAKYTLTISPPADPDPMGVRVIQSWAYEISGTDGSASVALPQDCVEVLTDIPVMSDAQSVIQENGLTQFVTASSAAQVVDFYTKNLPAQGWTIDQKLPAGEVILPFTASFTKVGRNISLHLAAADPTGVEVTIMLISGAGPPPTAEPGAGATATPGILPTVEKSENGLPKDVPLYPGATDLSNPVPQMLRFQTDDTPDQVDQWYQEQMPAQKWTSLSITKPEGTILQVWTKDKRIVTISIIPQGKKTLVMITFSD